MILYRPWRLHIVACGVSICSLCLLESYGGMAAAADYVFLAA